FLQSLVKNAGASMPSIGQWVAPTLDPAEIEKRIQELKTVQFWLEQNARMLAATIQALEVQRMTLSTLQTMNVQMADLRDSLTLRVPDSITGAGERTTAGTASAQESLPEEPAPPPKAAPKPHKPAPKAAPAAPSDSKAVDPLQWWGALTRQFTELAASAMQDSAVDAARGLGAVGRAMEPAAGAQSPKAQAAASHQRATRKRARKRKPAPTPAQP
ncbi:MAG TPA: PhaM family polyhydroxyalkanoate granule multifunctional regulatory protein, partial [Caldimonas sp.]|nr:PhaM family polyhydroxyalkanoate granule multifunctional regulatory protein [Caldimonas sp.]